MKVIAGERLQDRKLVLYSGESVTIAELASKFLVTSGSFHHRPQVEEELHAVFDLIHAATKLIARRKAASLHQAA